MTQAESDENKYQLWSSPDGYQVLCSMLDFFPSCISHLKQAQQILQGDLDADTKLQLAAVALQALDWRCKHLMERLRRFMEISASAGFKMTSSRQSSSPHLSNLATLVVSSSPSALDNPYSPPSNGVEHANGSDRSGNTFFLAQRTCHF
jgi:hypothetical protein